MTSCYTLFIEKVFAIGRGAKEGVDPRVNIIRFLQRKTESSYLYDYKTVQQALRFMRSHGYTEIPVVNQDGFYLGVVGEGDFLWHVLDYGGYESVKDDKVGTFVQRGNIPALKITATDADLQNAAVRCTFVPIVDDRNVFVGVITRKDVLQYFADKMRKAAIEVTA